MRSIRQAFHPGKPTRQPALRKSASMFSQAIEALETRVMMDTTTTTPTETVATPLSSFLATTATPASDTINLDPHFFDATLPGTLVTFNTSEGSILVGLTDQATPLTVANFLDYVQSGAYNGSFFHRSATFQTDSSGNAIPPSATTPAAIIQGGGFNFSNGSINAITTNAPVQDEYTTELYGDSAGTLAVANTGQPDTGSSQWFFNVGDNTQTLDEPALKYTVFGKIINDSNGDSTKTISAIADLATDDINDTALPTVPVENLTQAQADADGSNVPVDDLVFVNSVTSERGTSYAVTSDDPALVSPTVDNTSGTLSFNYGSGVYGTAGITVTATNLDGTSTSTTFDVTVADPTHPAQGPTAQNFTSGAIVSGTAGVIDPLNNSLDSGSPLVPAGVTIVTAPTDGTATVDTSTGHINYTSNAGFVGNDTLTYTVTDAAGATSTPATITVDVVPTAVKVTIGTAAAGSLTFTQPDGTVGHLRVFGGTAVVTFTDYQVTTKTAGGVLTATGEGTTITNVTITNIRGEIGALSLVSTGAVTLGSVDDTGLVSSIVAPKATLTGTSTLAGLNLLNIAAANYGSLVFGGPYVNSTLLIPTATNFSIQANGIGTIKSRQWLNTDGGAYKIYAAHISVLNVTGTFAENLSLQNAGYDLISAKVGTATGTWSLAGSMFLATMGAPASTWSYNGGGVIQKLSVKGTLSSTIVAAAVNTISVTGDMNGAVIQTDGKFSKALQIGRISVTGAITSSVIFSAGNIGSITAASMATSRIYAGVELSVAEASGFANVASDLTDDAKINSISLGKKASSFSSSQINADIIGTLNLGDIETTTSDASPEGIAGHTIGSVKATLNAVKKPSLAASKTQLKTAATFAAYVAAEKLTLDDFVIDIY